MVDAELRAAYGLIGAVVLENREWMDANRALTLGDLLARLELALTQCLAYVAVGDPPIADRAGISAPLAEELALWPIAAEENGAPRLFSDAGVRLAGFAWRVSALEQCVGSDATVGRLLDYADGACDQGD